MSDGVAKVPLLVAIATGPVPPARRDRLADIPAGERREIRAVAEEGAVALVSFDDDRAGAQRLTGARQLALLVSSLVDDVLRPVPGPVVALALDRMAELALWEAGRQVDHVVAVHTVDAATRVAAMLAGGWSLEEVLFPPPFSVRRSLAGEPAEPPDPAPDPRVVLVDEPVEDGAAWMSLGADRVTVRTGPLEPLARRALVARRSPGPGPFGPRSRRDRQRLVVGPANYAGQGWQWARAVRRYAPGWSAETVQVFPQRAALAFGADLPMVTEEWQDAANRVDIAAEHLLGATHVLVEAMRPLLGVTDPTPGADAWDPYLGRADADALVGSGRRVGLLFHGSEVRRPDVHAQLTPWSPFGRRDAAALTKGLARRTTQVHDAMGGFEGPLFVSTLDLLDYVPDATWLPVVVGPASFSAAPPALLSPRPVVAHAPSSSALKGSEWIDPVLQRLDERGLISYRRVTDLPPAGMSAFLRGVDVVVDQVVLGNPGVLAAQAMAAGRLVVAHLPEPVRSRFPSPPPVVEATPDTVEEVVVSVLEDRERYSVVAAAGVAFARTHHDGRLSARILTEGLLDAAA